MAIDREGNAEENAKAEEDISKVTPEPKTSSDKNKARATEAVALTGDILLTCAGISTAVLLVTYLAGAIGLSTLLTIILLTTIGIILKYAGSVLSTGNWNPLTA